MPRNIPPLRVPWLPHDQFPATKAACSTADGLVSSSKSSLVKVVHELKRGRANVDKQLSQLDTQLVAISDYLDGKRSTMFPPNVIVYVEDTQDAVVPLTGEGRRLCGAGAAAGTDQFSGVVVNGDSVVPTPAAVEDDLQSETPCTTTGLWKYLYAYSFFKTITPEYMDQALLLEDLHAFFEDLEPREVRKSAILTGQNAHQLQSNLNGNKSTPLNLDGFFMERLVASLCVVEAPASTNTSHEACSSEPDGDDKRLYDATASTLDTETTRHPVGLTGVQPRSPKGLTRVLRHVGLVEGNETEIARISLSNLMDDEVSQEIRSLQRQLEACVRETNETKRKLWRLMDETKPWLSQRREEEETTIKEYITMWRTKKELARKKKRREKKLQRRQAFRRNNGGNGKLLVSNIYIEQR
ncbi:unnamed protein product [Hyaloperonospora brassicae]|uniref:Uncharacterized protein n=1 Tax=Hyaloperonospora brassicae TaxID=162125 RepID=A0AAV0U5R6_HYABA|nr:unnamed protein product [Hyaloperonospora brassicae]